MLRINTAIKVIKGIAVIIVSTVITYYLNTLKGCWRCFKSERRVEVMSCACFAAKVK